MAMERNVYTVVSTKFGLIGAFKTQFGMRKITLPMSSYYKVLRDLQHYIESAVEDATYFNEFSDQIRRYFEGERITFSDKLDLNNATDFQQAVWKYTQSVPFGETRSYGWIAQQIGYHKAARAVGNALSRNCLPIVIPCHRIIASDGELGGFTGGLTMKKRLLQLEGLEL